MREFALLSRSERRLFENARVRVPAILVPRVSDLYPFLAGRVQNLKKPPYRTMVTGRSWQENEGRRINSSSILLPSFFCHDRLFDPPFRDPGRDYRLTANSSSTRPGIANQSSSKVNLFRGWFLENCIEGRGIKILAIHKFTALVPCDTNEQCHEAGTNQPENATLEIFAMAAS